MPLFVGQAAGAAVLQTNQGITDWTGAGTTPVLAACTTHDLFPAGTGGTCVFRGIVVVVRHDGGYAFTVTPVVDGLSLPTQAFNGGAPEAGNDGLVTVLAPFSAKGTRVSAAVSETAAFGSFELANIAAQFVVIRTAP